MDPTNPENDEPLDDVDGLEPEMQQSSEAEKQVPLKAVLEERNKRKALSEQLAKAQAEIERLSKQTASQKKAEATPVDDIRQELHQLKRESKLRATARELGLAEAQADAVLKTIEANPSLNTAEALTIAKMRDAALFAEQTGSGMVPGQNPSLRPTPGSQPVPPETEWDLRKKRLAALSGSDQIAADQLRSNMIGSLAAQAMGLPHHKIPI